MWPLLFLLALTIVNAFSPRIIGGSNTTIDKYPYQVSIHQGNKFQCGGSIISPNWVLTAAHCVVGYPPQLIQVRVQSTYTNKGGILISSVKSIKIHDMYDDDFLYYDAALLELSSAIPRNAHSKPIALPNPGSTIPAESKAVVTGWGHTSIGGSPSSTLQVLTAPVVDQTTCKNIYKGQRPVIDALLCAGSMSGSQDVCTGDSGGPLMYNQVQIGIVSWGFECAKKGYPGVYTRVSERNVRSWIEMWAKV